MSAFAYRPPARNPNRTLCPSLLGLLFAAAFTATGETNPVTAEPEWYRMNLADTGAVQATRLPLGGEFAADGRSASATSLAATPRYATRSHPSGDAEADTPRRNAKGGNYGLTWKVVGLVLLMALLAFPLIVGEWLVAFSFDPEMQESTPVVPQGAFSSKSDRERWALLVQVLNIRYRLVESLVEMLSRSDVGRAPELEHVRQQLSRWFNTSSQYSQLAAVPSIERMLNPLLRDARRHPVVGQSAQLLQLLGLLRQTDSKLEEPLRLYNESPYIERLKTVAVLEDSALLS